MREIKFRAWDGKEMHQNVVMVDGNAFKNEKRAGSPIQYTGLKDKNGKEIYEGDIHKLGDEVGAVEYHDGTYFVLGEYCTRFLYQELTEQKGEVIGNIYEHPELLK